MSVKGDWDFDNPLRQAFRETASAFAAFSDYYEMGPHRSMLVLHAVYIGENTAFPSISQQYAGLRVPSTSLPMLKKWSTTFNWQARLARRAEIEVTEREARRRQRRIELEEANWNTGSLLRERCNEFTALLEEFKQTRTETIQNDDGEGETRMIYLALNASIDQIARGLKIADELQQRSVEISEEETNGKLNGGSLIRSLIRELDGLVSQRQIQDSSEADGDGTP